MVRSWHSRSPSQAGARPLSATDAWLGAVAGDETDVGTIYELVHQVHDGACNTPSHFTERGHKTGAAVDLVL